MLQLSLAIILAAQSWLVISDIHFDPFAKPAIVDKLAATPPDRWRAVFASEDEGEPAQAGSDTNDALLELALEGARNEVADPRVVIVSGDFLAHDFRGKFDRTAKVHDDAAYRAFVDKTIGFLAWELQAAFPRARFLPVAGNNDSYCGDYKSTPRDAYLARMGADWAASIGPGDPNAFIAQFSTGGYYTATLPVADGAEAIVLNDVFWSTGYTNACGDSKTDPGGDELTWLQSTLAAVKSGTPVWVIAHIPPGIDGYASLHNKSGQVVAFLADRFNTGFIDALSKTPAEMALTGHTHFEGVRVIGPNAGTPRTPMLVVPAISPIYGNAPAFTVLTVDENDASVLDEQRYAFARNRDAWSWRRSFDFDAAFGSGTIDAARLWRVLQASFNDANAKHDATWRANWCTSVALTVTSYTACAMPQALRDTEVHPAAPATPSPTPSPSPAPSVSPSSSPSPSPSASPGR